MARRRGIRGQTPGERMAVAAVFFVLACAAVWLGVRQGQFNPAVIVAINHPKGAASLHQSAPQAQTATAAVLTGIQGFDALSLPESYDSETLSDKIDGKAELYLASGYQEMSCRAFGGDSLFGARVEVYLYAMEAPKDAFAVFSGQRRQGAEPLPLGSNAYATDNALYLTQDRFYVEVVADKAGPEVRPSLEMLAQAVLAALPAESGADAAQSETGLFPPQGLKADSVRLAVSDALGMEGLENVYTAEYATASGQASAFLALRDTPEQAAAQAQAYTKFLVKLGFTPAPDAPDAMTVLDQDGSRQVVFSVGRALAGVHDAANPQAALELARALRAALEATQQ